MPLVQETDYLVPTGSFLISILVFAALFAVLVVWPFIDAMQRRQWGWVLAVVFFAPPMGGILWIAVGRKETGLRHGASDVTKSAAEPVRPLKVRE